MSESRVIRILVPEAEWPHSLDQCSDAEWRAAVDTPLGFAIEQAQDAVLELLPENGGVVLFVAPAPRHAASQTVVAGLHGLTRSIAKEYGARLIRCNLLVGLVGDAPDMERLLTENPAITGELLVADIGAGLVGAAGLDGGSR